MISCEVNICADSLNDTFQSIQDNNSWDLMPGVVAMLGVALHMTQKDLRLYCIDSEYGPRF